jgi:hypothetical protein
MITYLGEVQENPALPSCHENLYVREIAKPLLGKKYMWKSAST